MKTFAFIFSFYILIGILSSLIISPYLFKLLKLLKAKQILRKEGPQEHSIKQGTLTMGGIIIFLPIFVLVPILCNFSKESLIIVFSIFLFFIIGFIDDLLIILKGKNDGLRPKLKLLLQIVFSLFFCFLIINQGHDTYINIPIFNTKLELGYLYIPFIVFIITGTSNAINLTDGLDGLAAGNVLIALIPFTLMLNGSNNNFSYVAIITSLICIGTCIGFLWFNSYPAQIFMGDTGSIPLGAILAIVAILGNNELWLPIIGIIFVVETLSVIIQVLYFKKTKKRFFLMSPLHHHFEKKGLKETKISMRFYIVTIISSLTSLSMYFYN